MNCWKCNICHKVENSRQDIRNHVRIEHNVASKNTIKDQDMALRDLYERIENGN